MLTNKQTTCHFTFIAGREGLVLQATSTTSGGCRSGSGINASRSTYDGQNTAHARIQQLMMDSMFRLVGSNRNLHSNDNFFRFLESRFVESDSTEWFLRSPTEIWCLNLWLCSTKIQPSSYIDSWKSVGYKWQVASLKRIYRGGNNRNIKCNDFKRHRAPERVRDREKQWFFVIDGMHPGEQAHFTIE